MKNIFTLSEGFDFDNETLIKDAEDSGEYFALDLASNAAVVELVKDLDIRQILTAMTGVVPPPGWKNDKDERSGLLTLDSKWHKWADDMQRKLVLAGWTVVPYPRLYGATAIHVATNAASGKQPGEMSKKEQQWYNEYQQLLQKIPDVVFGYLQYLRNSGMKMYLWKNICISPDGGLFFVQRSDEKWYSDPTTKTTPHVIAASGTKYYIMKDAVYDVKAERHLEVAAKKGLAFLVDQWHTFKVTYRSYWNNGQWHTTYEKSKDMPVMPLQRIIRKYAPFTGLDTDGYPVIRMITDEKLEYSRMSRIDRKEGKYIGEFDLYLKQQYFYKSGRDADLAEVDLTEISDPMKPYKLYVHRTGTFYYALYTKSSCPAVFSDAASNKKMRTPQGAVASMIYEFGLTDKGVAAYDAKFGKPKK